jgi:hypothetical protein
VGDREQEMAVERCAANRIDENISGAVDIDELSRASPLNM